MGCKKEDVPKKKVPKCTVRCKVWVRAATEANRHRKENERANPPGSDGLWMMFNVPNQPNQEKEKE